MEFALNNLQRLICHKTQQTKPNQTEHPFYLGVGKLTPLQRKGLYFLSFVNKAMSYTVRNEESVIYNERLDNKEERKNIERKNLKNPKA